MHPEKTRLGRWTRLSLALLAVGIAGLLAVARGLEPDPRGYGTHLQLGLSACSLRSSTGVPCPSCGMTTAFAWFVRGELDRAWGANPGGLALAVAGSVLVPWLLATAAWGRSWPTRSPGDPLAIVLLGVATWTVLAWGYRMVFTWRVLG